LKDNRNFLKYNTLSLEGEEATKSNKLQESYTTNVYVYAFPIYTYKTKFRLTVSQIDAKYKTVGTHAHKILLGI